MTTVFIGIDAGAKGGIAAITKDVHDYQDVFFKTLPESDTEKWEIIKRFSPSPIYNRVVCVIERILPGSFEGSAKDSVAKLYGSYRFLCGLLVASGIKQQNTHHVLATQWHRTLGISPRKKTETDSKWKSRLVRIAEKTFPRLAITQRTADALLISEFCRLKYEELK